MNPRTRRRSFARLCVPPVLLILVALVALRAQGPADGQKTFPSSKEAVDNLIQAVRADNKSELQAILGPGSEQIVSSGDEVADKAERTRFLAKYDAKHSLSESNPHELTLNVGTDEWPLPIPLVYADGKWYFDGPAGKEEILYRRIGHNELAAIDVCKGVVAAQRDYAATAHDNLPAGTYAQRIVSEPGKQNGLYWEVKQGETPSSAGPLLAAAAEEGYDTSGRRTPYHGYYYRILTAQGSQAKGSAESYIVDGRMSRGFAFIAYPDQYRASGVMTFIVNQDGVIYQKDLGEQTSETAQKMTDYNPDNSWTRVK